MENKIEYLMSVNSLKNDVLISIEYFEIRKRTAIDMCDMFGGLTRKKTDHNVDIYNRCIDRLWKRYNNLN